MPIYAYKCSACGHAEDVLQKISDAPLADCPACGQSAYSKQVTAAGFQLKGSGWYVTDFRNNNGAGKPAAGQSAAPAASGGAAGSASGGDAGSAPATPAPAAPAATST
ncbi:conserved hypothetical protein [Bordetella bronchiseptica MO211]|nr:conserved hypothetical protein [Bordetella bronchiseptica MO211]